MTLFKNTTSGLLLALPLILAAAPATAGPTSLASVPLMSLNGSGAVKPNLMMLYDNSGSMGYSYTPDYINNTLTCRRGATLAAATPNKCLVGDVPYMTPQFNRQYYNAALRYTPPVKADQTSYPSQTRANTTNWTAVTTDGYGLEYKDLTGDDPRTTNLVTGFPDREWCRNNSDCRRNETGYTYPDNTYRSSSKVFYGNPYYYTLNVNEYCTNDSLTNCVSTYVNAVAPNTTHKVPAPVRWCNTTGLTDCQSKYVDKYNYPRFGDPNRVGNWYVTINIDNSGSANAIQIDKVTASGKAGTFDITSGAVNYASGADTIAKRTAIAALVAKSINEKTGLDRPFMACVRTTTGTVPSCTNYGITLPVETMLAVMPATCPNKNSRNGCTVVQSDNRTNDTITVYSPTSATALLRFQGTTSNGKNATTIVNLKFAGQTWWSNGGSFAKNIGATQVAAALVNGIGTGGSVQAYVGGNTVTPQCASASDATLCLVGPASAVNTTPTIGQLNNPGSIKYTAVTAISNGVPTSVTGFDTGVFTRTDIVPERNSYPKSLARTDCAGAECTYEEEMTNFANWYAYYKTRNQMMKTAVGLAMQPLDKDYKLGIIGLQRAAGQTDYAVSTDQMLYPAPFTGQHRENWYKSLYAMYSNGGTPVRQALNEIGNMFANKGTFKQKKGEEVVEYACQQNFTFVTTDGYWNGPSVSGPQNNDNVENKDRFCTAATGCYDPSRQDKPSLADVALYWYNGGTNGATASLRPDLEGDRGMVPGTGNKRLHMRTYALGLGVDGIMKYQPDYDTNLKEGSDLHNIINQVQTGCPWTNGPWRWPDPQVDLTGLGDSVQARVDDLWHAAINGGGKYFAASDTQQVVDGLNEALNDIRESTGAAAASATSTPNITLDDADIFSSTFTTVKWTGNLIKRVIDPLTGEVDPSVIWSSSWTLGNKVKADTDTRSIWYRDPANGARREFTVDTLGTTEKAWFTNKCSALSQCSNLSADNKAIVNRPETLIGWLRGQQQYADGAILRGYSAGSKEEIAPNAAALPVVLGDIASSKPAYLRGARKSYTSADYAAYATEQADRERTVFIAANDGMLHAFNATSGAEEWAYMPRITMKKLHVQASLSYATEHQFTTDGSPELADVKIGNEWRTILVAGLNSGGRGYYALDVTDPSSPKPLWEICADSAICEGDLHQPELGFTYGNPQFGTIKDSSGAEKWVVFLTSGYNNIPDADGVNAGSGKGFLMVVDVATGRQVLNLGGSSISSGGILTTGSGSTDTPSGFAKITAITANPNTDPLVTYVYGGDNLGQMWRFDFTGASVQRVRMGSAGDKQPITTRPDVAMCQVNSTGQGADASPTRRIVVFGTGRMLDYADIKDTADQTVYVLNDTGLPVADSDWRTSTSFAERTLTETRPYDKSKPTVARSDEFTIDGDTVDLSKQSGWFVDFEHHDGERVNLDPKIVSGTLSVVTNVPESSTACTVGGTSYAYHINVCTGKAISNEVVGSLLSGDAAAVGFIIVRLPSGALKMITTDAKGQTHTTEVAEAESLDARRTGWRRVRE